MRIKAFHSLLALSLLFIFNFPFSASAANDITGIWQGTLGKTKIRACFNEYGTGSYYYQRYLTPIRLEQIDSHWQEDNQTGYWQLDRANEQQLIGQWSKTEPSASEKSLAITLERQISPDDVDDCSSDAYNLPLETPPKLTRGKWQRYENTNSHQITYRQLSYGTDIGIELRGPQTGIAAINQWLKHKLTNEDQLEDTFETRRRMLAHMGLSITDETSTDIVFMNQHWISVSFYRWAGGYGAGGINRTFTSFSLADGKPFHPWQWFIEDAKETHMNNSMSQPLPQALREKLFADSTLDPECLYSDGSGYYQLTLTPSGLKFWERPNGNGCENEFTLTPNEAMPFATEYGKSQLRLME